MPRTSHTISFALAVLAHVLAFWLLGWAAESRRSAEELAPELDITSVELTLAEEADALPVASSAPSAAASADPEPPQPVEVPRPVEPETPVLPDKPDFADELPLPPPEEPAPVPKPPPKPAPPTVAPSTPAPVEKPVPAASGKDAQAATIQPASGGAWGRVNAHPSLERAIRPNYPIGARRRGEEGTVILDVAVSAAGRATSVSLVSSCGFSELDKAAEKAAEQARFKPGTRDGKPVESAARLTIVFRLRDS